MRWRLSRYRAGDWVEVLSRDEILATLDEQGCIDGLPFMPEMLSFCGRRMQVRAVAHKTCETARKTWTGRRLDRTVHLAEARCDGGAHGGCQADCSLFWKDAWLKPAGRPSPPCNGNTPLACSEGRLMALTILPAAAGEELHYCCQATQLWNATAPLAWWDLRQYWRDWRTGNHRWGHAAGVLFHAALTQLFRRAPFGYRLLKAIRERTHRWWTGRDVPDVQGEIPPGKRTPLVHTGLQPGEYVRVKSQAEILKTLDQGNNNRGLSFDPEMAVYCGKVFRVRRVVAEILDEQTGQMVAMKQPCIVLEGAYCSAQYSSCRLLCPRAMPPYWREIWLERVDVPAAPATAAETPRATSLT